MRLELRPVGLLRDDGQVVGSRVRVQVTKNKVAAAWQVAELDMRADLGLVAEPVPEAAGA